MISGPITNVLLGAAIKCVPLLISTIAAFFSRNQELVANQDTSRVEASIENQKDQAGDAFVKLTRRILFLYVALTYCYLQFYYAFNPHIQYDVLIPKNSGWGLIGMFTGKSDYEVVTLTGGLLLMAFNDLMYVVTGFFAVPSSRR